MAQICTRVLLAMWKWIYIKFCIGFYGWWRHAQLLYLKKYHWQADMGISLLTRLIFPHPREIILKHRNTSNLPPPPKNQHLIIAFLIRPCSVSSYELRLWLTERGRNIKHDKQMAGHDLNHRERDLPLVLLFYPLLQSLDIIKSQMDICSVYCAGSACVWVSVIDNFEWGGGVHTKREEIYRGSQIRPAEEMCYLYTYRWPTDYLVLQPEKPWLHLLIPCCRIAPQ